MLAQHRSVADVHKDAHAPGDSDTNVTRRLDAPIEQDEREKVGPERERNAGERHEVREQAGEKRDEDEPRPRRQQDFLRPRRRK